MVPLVVQCPAQLEFHSTVSYKTFLGWFDVAVVMWCNHSMYDRFLHGCQKIPIMNIIERHTHYIYAFPGYSQPLKKNLGDNTVVIFANVGSSDPLGINYDNVWESNGDLSWIGKTRSKLTDKVIQEMLIEECKVLVFTRSGKRDPWFYNGIATPVDIQDETPGMIRWAFEERAIRARAEYQGSALQSSEDNTYNLLYVASATNLGTSEELDVRKIEHKL